MTTSARNNSSGFTLVELLVGVVISLTLFALAVAGYRNFNTTRTLRLEAERIKNFLNLSRQKAIHGEKPAAGCTPLNGFRVGLDSAKQVYREPICNGVAGTKQVSQIEESTMSVTGFPITFASLTGTIGQTATATITFTYLTKTTQVTVDSSGLIQYDGVIN